MKGKGIFYNSNGDILDGDYKIERKEAVYYNNMSIGKWVNI